MEHVILEPTRTTVPLPGEQLNVDAVLGVPYTGNEREPLVTVFVPIWARTEKEAYKVTGVVANVNVEPSDDVGTIEFELLEEIEKSLAMPVVAPDAPDTESVQVIVLPARAGDVQPTRTDAVVGIP